MYCSTCGTAVQNAARFCSSCGTSLTATREPEAERRPASRTSSAPLLNLKPRFIPWLSVISVLPLQLFLTVWGAFFFGGFATVGLQLAGTVFPKWAPFVISGCVFFFGIPFLSYITKQKTYSKTRYLFYPDKLDYFEGFFTTEEKSIDYSRITEINLRKGIFQKMYGLGTIILSTPATGYSGGRARSGIRITDISNPDRIYSQVKELIKRLS